MLSCFYGCWRTYTTELTSAFVFQQEKVSLQTLKNYSKEKCAVADPEGVQGVRANSPFRQNYFIFMGIFIQF